MHPGAAQRGDGLIPAHAGTLGRVTAQDVGDALGKNGQLGTVQGAHILLWAVGGVASTVQLGKMLGPNLAVICVISGRKCPAAAAIVKSQRCGQGRIGKIRGDFAQKFDIIQYEL